MASIKICDLCGKPMMAYKDHVEFRVKKRFVSFPYQPFWQEIDAHDSCVKKLMDAKKEAGHDA